MCMACSVPNTYPIVTLRGLCPTIPYDRKYSYSIDESGHTFLRGDSSSLIFYNTTLGRWVLWSFKIGEKVATSRAPEHSLMMGLVRFDFTDVTADLCETGEAKTEHVFKLTTCGENEFTCNDGRCIDLETRCDAKNDCIDESDEEDCLMIVTERQYRKDVPPFKVEVEGKNKTDVEVLVSIAIEDISRYYSSKKFKS